MRFFWGFFFGGGCRYHNFFAQIKGRKRFTLVPSTSWPEIRVYPFLHPSHAQCQANLSEADL